MGMEGPYTCPQGVLGYLRETLFPHLHMVTQVTTVPEWRENTGHEATARPMCATHVREHDPETVIVCRSPRPCGIKRCENVAAAWVLDTK